MLNRLILTAVTLIALNLSCQSNKPISNIDWTKIDQQAMIKAMSSTFNQVAEKLKPSILYVKLSDSDYGPSINAFVFKPEGYLIIPSYYDSKNIERIKVWIDETEYPAVFVDADKENEITVIKVQTDTPLKPVVLGDSRQVTTGQYIINIFALGEEQHFEKLIVPTVVSGRIEAKHDVILTGSGNLENYRYGFSSYRESGGLAVNLNGEVIGIARGSQILAFDRQVKTAEKLIAHSSDQDKPLDLEEKQPWTGFSYDELTEEYAGAWGLPPTGVLVNLVYENSPAGLAGLKREDVIIAVDDQPITKKNKRGFAQFDKLFTPEINHPVKFTIARLSSSNQPSAPETREILFKFDKEPKPKEFTADDIGIQVREITEQEYLDYDLLTRQGVVVTSVIRGSSAATSSSFGERLIGYGDVIQEFYGQPVNNLADFIKVVDRVRTEKPSLILVKLQTNNRLSHIALNLKIGQRTKDKSEKVEKKDND
ncbi:MAG: PDZ domain-containing protein [Planctomycetota bacterium]